MGVAKAVKGNWWNFGSNTCCG